MSTWRPLEGELLECLVMEKVNTENCRNWSWDDNGDDRAFRPGELGKWFWMKRMNLSITR